MVLHGAIFVVILNLKKKISDDMGVTIRLLPINSSISDNDKCIFTGKKSIGRVLFAKSY